MKAIASAIFLGCLVFASAPSAQAEAPQNPANGSTAGGGSPNGDSTDADTLEAPPARRFQPPYPFTVDELWAQMLKLAALPEGYVTRADVERTFAIKLLPSGQDPNHPEPPTYGVMHQDDDWYFTTSVTENSRTESSYYFLWGNDSGDRPRHAPEGMCITPAMVESGMKATGWTLARRKFAHIDPFTGQPLRHKREQRNYRKGRRGVLLVYLKKGCLVELHIMAEDHPHFEWTIFN